MRMIHLTQMANQANHQEPHKPLALKPLAKSHKPSQVDGYPPYVIVCAQHVRQRNGSGSGWLALLYLPGVRHLLQSA